METVTKTQSNEDGAPSAGRKDEGNTGTVSEFKNKYPALCQRCGKQFTVFHSEGHPDDGETFACGLMVEAMDAGNLSLGCAHFTLPVIRGNKAVCQGRRISCMCQPGDNDGHGACGKIINADSPDAPAQVREQCLARLAEIRAGPHTIRTVH